MSTVFVVTPIVIAAWPAISAAAAAAAASLGYAMVEQTRNENALAREQGLNRAEIEVENSEIDLGPVGASEMLVVEKDGVRATIRRDARGALHVCTEGKQLTSSQLKAKAEELVGSITQQYVYHRLVSEMKAQKMTIVDEELQQDRSVRIRVRNW